MKTFEVELTKTYKVTIRANNENEARSLSEFFTDDIANISTKEEELKYNFQIEEIKYAVNDAYQVSELK